MLLYSIAVRAASFSLLLSVFLILRCCDLFRATVLYWSVHCQGGVPLVKCVLFSLWMFSGRFPQHDYRSYPHRPVSSLFFPSHLEICSSRLRCWGSERLTASSQPIIVLRHGKRLDSLRQIVYRVSTDGALQGICQHHCQLFIFPDFLTRCAAVIRGEELPAIITYFGEIRT